MSGQSVGLARGILRNAAALLLVGLFAKGMGLVIAILVARFLGADAMGLYALLFSVTMLIETFISIGMSDSLVRDVAARPEQARNLYVRALRLVLWISVLPALALAVGAFFFEGHGDLRGSLLVIALGAPVSGAFVVSQAILQGSERVLLLTWVSFIARVASLIWLAIALYYGAGVESAFASRVLFQAICVVVFFVAIRRIARGVPLAYTMRDLLTRSLPFALNQGLRDLAMRLPSLVLPGTAGLAASGVFDTGNRVRATLGMTMSAAIIGLMPSFARNLGAPDQRANQLVGFSFKYMCLGMSVVATGLSLGADWLVRVLFGQEFASAVLPLQILVWVQVLVAVDAVLQQAVLAAGHEYVAVSHSGLAVCCQLVLILLFTPWLGLPGVAVAVLLSTALACLLDLRFVLGRVAKLPLYRFVVGPLLAAASVAIVLHVTREFPLPMRLLAAFVSWAAATLLLRLMPRDELVFMRQMLLSSRTRRPKQS